GEVEGEAELAESARRVNPAAGRRSAARSSRDAPRDVLRLREEFADVDAELRPRLEHAERCLAQGQILLGREADKRVKRGVVEGGPPAAEVLGLPVDARVGGVDPVRSNLDWRSAVIGTDLEAVLNPLPQGVAAHP